MEPGPVSLLGKDGNHREQHNIDVSRPGRRASDPGHRKAHARVSRVDSSQNLPERKRTDVSLNAFNRLPQEVIERILYAADANVFASLALLNREWRRISSSAELYYHHLLRCRTLGSAGADPVSDLSASDDIRTLRNRFTREARRNTFEVFLRPKRTLVNLISASASSSSAFPQGEAFRFEFSANGRQLLALSSSRIFVIDLTTDPISVRHELKTLRRPLTATIADNGATLAVASSEHQAHVYILADGHAKLMQSIVLSEVPRTLGFSPDAAVLAVAYDGGIEVYAVGEDVLPTARRAVRCPGVDSLTFCCEGSMLLGTSNDLQSSNLVTISPPLCTDSGPDLTIQELESRMWTTQILFPQVHDGYSHAALVPSIKDGDGSSWLVGYGIQSKAFVLVPLDDLSSGTIYFVGPGADTERDEPKPHILPAVSGDGEFLAVGFQESELWVYGIPNVKSHHPLSESPAPQSTNIQEKEPVWKSSSVSTNFNRLRKTIEGPKTFVHGSPLRLLDGVSAIKWVHGLSLGDISSRTLCRLVAVAPGGVSSWLGAATGDQLPIDGGRIMVFDFECSVSNGEQSDITIELGEVEPIKLPEPGSNLDQQVELERRRTQMNRRGGLGGPRNPSATNPGRESRRNQHLQTTLSTNGGGVEDIPLMDNPYNNSSPRSRDTINRAATAAANRLNPRYHYARQVHSGVRRSRPSLSHESNADNWLPPPPPYTPNAEAPLPEHLRRTLLPAMTESRIRNGIDHTQLRRSRTSRLESTAQAATQQSSIGVNRDPNNQIPAAFQPASASPAHHQHLPVLNTNSSASNSLSHNPHAVSPSQQAPLTLPETHDANSHPMTQASLNLSTQYHSSHTHTTPAQHASPPTFNHQGLMQPTIENPNTSDGTSSLSQAAPVTRNSVDMRPRPLTPDAAETRRSWYNSQLQASSLDPSVTHGRPASRGNLVGSDLRAHHRADVHPIAPQVPSARNHGVRQPRSRSQDAPRFISSSNHGVRDRHTGRRIFRSESDSGFGENTQLYSWQRPRIYRNRRKEAKCVMM
ncbi:hypothetical protein PRK78_004420 [Emydomyces testavorans]|uniref:F-box domain-containing protein n=1 Tax=Emydomyces testavorans TaxID=2070801 RepID=A0AAF0DI28_9EURO|nr:hypothetical protein PRK78_004420 [Emydomyces testavorans]